MNRRLASVVALSTMTVALSACSSLWPSYERPAIDLPVTAATPVAVDRAWWKSFGDPVLDKLVDEAITKSFDLAKAVAAIDEANASLASARSLLTPRVDGVGKLSTSRRQLNVGLTDAEFNSVTTTATLGAGISWEVDLWGRIRQMNEAAQARLASSQHTRNAVELSVAGAVVDTWLQLRSLDAKLALTREAVSTLRTATDLEYRRWKADAGTQLAYQQSAAELASTEARVPSLEAAIRSTELALQLLTGQSPRDMAQRLERGAWPRLPEVSPGVDTIVLLRRPDVASAELLLAAAHADINSARAEFYPRLSLSLLAGLIGSTSNAISGMPLFWEAAAGMSGPIYDGGLVQSKVDGAEARRAKALAHYRYTVSVAFRDTYDALSQVEATDRAVALSESEVAVRRKSLALSQRSYDAGRSSKFEVLSETTKVLNAQLQFADNKYQQLLSRSRYFKALGGGF